MRCAFPRCANRKLAAAAADQHAVATHRHAITTDEHAVAPDDVGAANLVAPGDVVVACRLFGQKHILHPADGDIDAHCDVELVAGPHPDSLGEVAAFELDPQVVEAVLRCRI